MPLVKGMVPYCFDHTDFDPEQNVYRKQMNPSIDATNERVEVELSDFSCFNNQYNHTGVGFITLTSPNLMENLMDNRPHMQHYLASVSIGEMH